MQARPWVFLCSGIFGKLGLSIRLFLGRVRKPWRGDRMDMNIPQLRRDLLRWYSGAKRDLPWRRTRDPYAILVSEMMLQQTQVKTALPYYERFLGLFPDARALASAPEEKVLSAWAGLGYYRRARYLHSAAKTIVAVGTFPQSFESIRLLPGVGDYTAAAVASIAFGLPRAVVDGNVIRVMARLLALEENPVKGAGAAVVRATAQALLDKRHPGDFNQAVMELGASLCAPSRPRCPDCPLKKNCAGFLAGNAQDYPRLPARPATRVLMKAVLLLVQGAGARRKVLLRVRTDEKTPKAGQAADRLRGFWAFPELELPQAGWNGAQALVKALAHRLGGPEANLQARLPRIRHRITVYDIHLWPFYFKTPLADRKGRLATAGAKEGWEWVTLGRVATLPLASAEKKLLLNLKTALEPRFDDDPQGRLKL